MSSTDHPTLSTRAFRGRQLVSMLAVLGVVMTTLVQTGFDGTTPVVEAGTTPPFSIDGTVPDAGAQSFPDPFGSAKELGPENSNNNKLAVINTSPVPMLGFTDVPGKSDLTNIWLDVKKDADEDQWLYFAWDRETTSGATVVAYEFQQAPIPAACDYTGVSQIEPASGTPTAAQQALIDNCNPWSGRSSGDFMIVFDFGGSSVDISRRTWNGTVWSNPTTLNAAVSAAALNASQSRGEGAVNLTDTVFQGLTECLSIANILPGTITGNSDQADYKDTVLADFSNIFISNCGGVQVKKVTEPAGGQGSFPITLDRAGGGDINYAGAKSATSTLTQDGQVHEFVNLLPGADYRLAENLVLPNDWALKSIVCDGVDVTTGTFAVVIGDEKDCVVTNKTNLANLTVVKVVDNLGESGPGYLEVGDFELTIDGVAATSGVAKVLYAGSHTVAEQSQPGYTVGTWSCSNGTTGTPGSQSATVNLNGGDNVTCTITNTLIARPSMTIDKSSTTASLSAPVSVPYSYVVTNTGNVTITGLSLVDDNTDAAPTCAATTIPVGGSTTCTATHTFTQAELDADGSPNAGSGVLFNTVVASSDQAPDVSDDLSIPINQDATMSLVKSSATTSLSAPGTVTYSYLVSNTGNVTITGLSLVDDNTTAAPTCLATTIPVGGSTTCSATHTFTQAELDANGSPTAGSGVLFNNVVASSNETPDASDDLSIPIVQSPAMTVDKSSATTSLSAPATVTYSYLVTNTGNVTITGLSLVDDNDNDDMVCVATTIPVGGSTTCSATHTFTQAELDANGSPTADSGFLTNNVTASSNETPDASDDLSIPIVQSPSMTVDKSSATTSLSAPATVTYSYLVTNTGNVTITGLSLVDDNDNDDMVCVATTIPVGGSTTCSATHTFTQAELDANGSPTADSGFLTNNVTASSNETPDASDDLSIPIVQSPSMTVDKSSATTSLSAPATVTYSYLVTNTGNVTITGLSLVDDNDNDDMVCVATTIPVGGSTTCSATHTFTQAELDANGSPTADSGFLSNNVTASSNETPDASDDLSIPISQTPSIALIKTGTWNDGNNDGFADAGETITYAFTVTNTGNVTLFDVTLADTIGGVTIDGGPIASLAAGAVDSTTFTGSYTLTQDDVDAGVFMNLATATGTSQIGDEVSSDDDDTQLLPAGPSVALVKTGTLNDDDGTAGVSAGDTISYTFEVSNTGNVTLSDVTVEDTVGGVTVSGGPIASLAAGATDSTTFTGSYTLTQGDIDFGSFENVATVTGTPPSGPDVTNTDDDTQVLAQVPSIDLVKTGTLNDDDGTSGVSAGDTISYAFTVSNTGNVTLTDVTVADTVGGVSIAGGPIASLAVGASDDTTFTGSYTLTQGDIDFGSFENVATASGQPPSGDRVSDDDNDIQELAQTPSINLVKTGTLNDDDGTDGVSAGDTISYAFTVTNTGNVTLTDVTVADTVGGVSIDGGPIASLAVGASDDTTFTGSYTLTQDDIDFGSFTNVATASGQPPSGDRVSDVDDDTQRLAPGASIVLIKTGTLNDDDGTPGVSAGDTISYAFTVSNDGNVTLTDVTVADTVGGVSIDGGPIASLAVGASDDTTFTGSYTLTQGDIDFGSFENVATASGQPPSGDRVSDDDNDVQALAQVPSINLVKTGTLNDDDGTDGVSAGDTISYAFTVSNTGNVTLTDVTVADTVGGVSITGGPIASLAVGASDDATFTGSYTLTQDDIDFGSFTNVATASGTPPSGDPVTDDDDDIQELAQVPSINLVKTGTLNDDDGTPGVSAGDTISYAFTVTNTGNVTLTNVTLADTVGGVTITGGPIAVLAVDAVDSTTFTGSYTLTQADVDFGSFENVATATGTPPSGDPVSDDDNDIQELAQTPSIDLVKTGTLNDDDGTAGVSAGDTISYTFTVSNTGNVTLTNVTLADTVGGVTITGGPIASLAVGASDSTTFTGSYTLTQADVDAGAFENVATATGTPPIGEPVTDDDNDIQVLEQAPSIALIKTGTWNDANDDGFADAGETITYAFTVSNTGNVTLTNVTLADTVGGVTIDGGPIATLAVGASDSTTFTGSYTLTQDDVDAGVFTNVATATGQPPFGDPVSSDDDDTQPLPAGPSIDLVKTGTLNDDDGTDGVSAGDTISYTFTVTNTGNVTLTDVTVADTVGGVTINGGPIASLAVDASDSTTFTGSYTLTQADIDFGSFENVATASGQPPIGDRVTDDDNDIQELAQVPSIELIKTGTLNDDDGTDGVSAGDTISYVFTVSNTGNVTLTDVTLADTVGGVTISGGPIAVLAVGASDGSTFTGSYTLTQADVDAGTFTNIATASGTPPSGDPVTDVDDDTQRLVPGASIVLVKTGTLNDDDGAAGVSAGDTISYAFTVSNTGNVTLTNVTLADTVGGVTISGGPIAVLVVGASDSTTFTGSYTLTQADVDAGTFENLATATGTPPIGDPVTDDDNDIQELAQVPSINLVKTGTLNDDDGTDGVSAGDTISYAFTVSNTGNVTLTDVTVADTVGGVSITGGPIASLAVGASDDATFTGSYTLTQDDIDFGSFTNVATASGTPPSGDPVTDDDDDIQELAQVPSINLVKTGTLNDDDGTPGVSAGDTISYAFTVTNTGNVTLTNVTLADTVGGVTITGGPIAVLAVDAVDSTTFTGSYTLTQADVDFGSFENVATATGTPPSGDPVSDDDNDIQELAQTPSIDLVKTGTLNDDDGTAGVSAGDTISYTFTVSNTGNVTLTNVTLADTVGGVTITGGPIASLAVGASDSTTFTGSYTLTQADVDAGAFENVATATGTPPIGEPVTDDDNDIQVLEQAPSIALIKTGTWNDANDDGFADAGETITYAFTVSNTGNVTLTNVTLADTVGGVTIDGGPIATLAVGASDSTTFTGSYTLTQDDVDAGVFTNVATATGQPPFGDPVSSDDDDTQPLPAGPSIDLVKTGTLNDDDGTDGVSAGDTISYTFTVTNTGNVTLTDVTVADTVGGVTINGGPIASLAVDASDSTTFTGSYTLTQADIDAGTFENVATATGQPPAGDPVTDDDNDIQELAQAPSIELIKTGTLNDDDGTDGVSAGDTISYVFTVSNTGNVTLTNVTLADLVGGVTIIGDPIATLAVGASDSTTFTGSYTLTQDDIDAGSFSNTARATGTPPIGADVSDTDDDVQGFAQGPSITIVKTGTLLDDDGIEGVSAGDTISYSFTVANTGNVTLTDVAVSDTVGGVTITGGPIAVLAVGTSDSTTFTGTYTLTQLDIDAGTFENVATAIGTPPIGEPVTDDDNDIQELAQVPSIDLVKTGTLNDDDGTAGVSAGDTISYSFTVSNTGNVTLTNVTLADTVGGVTISGGPIAALAVGTSDDTTFTGSYTLTQGDIDAGTFENVATATGTPPIGEPVTDDDDDVQELEQTPSIELTKTGTWNDADDDTIADVGETITYSFAVENTGNVTLTNVTLADTIGGVTISGSPIAVLPVGAVNTTNFTGSYTLTQADVDAGTFTNVAVATGTPPSGDPVTDDDDDVQDLPQAPSIEIVKTGTFDDQSADDLADVGETITYRFRVSNTGNVTLTNVTVTDVFDAPSNGASTPIVCAADNSDHVIDTMAPGAVVTCSSTYTLTQADVDHGGVSNVATARGTDPDGEPIVDTDDEQIDLPANADLAIVKTASVSQVGAGSGFDWILQFTNNGPATATDVLVGDIVPGPLTITAVTSSDASCSRADNTVTCTVASLAPGATGRVTISVSVPAAAPGGTIVNVGTVESETPDPDLTNNSDEESVVVVAQVPPTVAPPPPVTLPRTGSDATGDLVRTAFLLLAVGAGVVLVARRRRDEPTVT